MRLACPELPVDDQHAHASAACSSRPPRTPRRGAAAATRTHIPVRTWNRTSSSSRLSSREPTRGSRPRIPGWILPSWARAVAADDGRGHQEQGAEAAGQAQPVVGPEPAGNVPDRVHGVLGALGDPETAPQGAEDADDQADAGALDGGDAVLDLGAHDGELPDKGVDDLLLQLLVVGQRVAEHGDEHQQQREQRQKAVVGEQRGVLAGLVVAELLGHPEREPEHRVALLEPVQRPQQPLDPRHRRPQSRACRP